MKNEHTSSTAPLLIGMAAGAALGAAGVMATNTNRNVVEVFLNNGEAAGSMLFQGADGDGEFRFVADGKVDCVDVRVLDGIWR